MTDLPSLPAAWHDCAESTGSGASDARCCICGRDPGMSPLLPSDPARALLPGHALVAALRPRVVRVPVGRTLTGRCAGRASRVPNAAERWSASLPSPVALAIRAERARRDVRPGPGRVVLESTAGDTTTLGPLPAFRSAWHEARRNALLCALVVAALVAAWHWIAYHGR